jgi:hypothetical protein
MKKVTVICTGFSTKAPADLLKKSLEKKGKEVVVLDMLSDLRKESWLFRNLLLTEKDHTFPVNAADAFFQKIKSEGKSVETVITHSYGAVAILAPSLEAEEYILIAPPLGSVRPKLLEKIFSFLPGFQELRNGTVQEKLFNELFFLKTSEKKLDFFISSFRTEKEYGDERVSYLNEVLWKMLGLGNIRYFHGVKHRQYMLDPEVIKCIPDENESY